MILAQDLRCGLRMLAKQPVFAAVAVVSPFAKMAA